MITLKIDDASPIRFSDGARLRPADEQAVLWLLRNRCSPEFVQSIKSELGRQIQNERRQELVAVGAVSQTYSYPL